MDPLTREELLRLLGQCNPRTRKTKVYAVHDTVEDGVASVHEELSFIEPDGTVRAVELSELRMCPCCGRAIGPDTHVMGRVSCCSAIVCVNCYVTCVRCGRGLCRTDAFTYSDGEVYCRSCRWTKWLKLFFRIPPKGAKK